MGTASLFDDILKKKLNIHAAWLPITNTFEIGDYGLVSDGVLVKMGNIRTFGVSWSAREGKPAQMDFASDDAHMTRFVGEGKVNALPDQDLDARFTIEFEKQCSFLIKARLISNEMQDLAAVADKLYAHQDWDSSYRVVSAVHVGQQCTILSSNGANSKIELSGNANALRQFDLAGASAGIQVSNSQRMGLSLIGQTGVIGLSLFKVGWLLGGVYVLGRRPRTLAGAQIKIEKEWGKLDDDV
jgi:hypothetical protein